MRSYRKNLGIVVGVDGSLTSKVAVKWAAHDAQLRKLPLTLVHLVSTRMSIWPRRGPSFQRAHRIMRDMVAIVDGSSHGDPPKVNTMVASGDPVATLAHLSADAEMIVVGSRRQSAWRRHLRPSISSCLLHRSQCPVAVIHDEQPLADATEAPVLASYGGSVAAVMLARDEASRRGVELIISDEAVSRLVEQSESAQLTVVGGWDHVGASVAHAARMPVVVAK